MILRIFNPSHDECLASGSPFYTPSAVAQGMDEALMPGWLSLSAIKEMANSGQLDFAEVEQIEPWGWDARIVHQLRKCGCPERLLPSEGELQQIRRLSSRETAVHLLREVRERVPKSIGESRWLSAENVEDMPNEGVWVFKQPWSCSGRGVRVVNLGAANTENDRAWIRKTLRTQGGIECEPFYKKVADFAMEFYADGSQIVFEGYSCFVASPEGFYGGNLVLPDAEIVALMTQYVEKDVIMSAQEALRDVLEVEVLPYYKGPLGVDMMIVEGGNVSGAPCYFLHPCVELNLRNTMGRMAIERR